MQPPYENGDSNNDWMRSTRMIPALVVIGVGVLFLLNNLHIIVVEDLWAYWPVILIVLGVFKLVDGYNPHRRMGGAVLLGVGSLFLANNLGLLPANIWDFWPVLLIGLGVLMIIDRGFIGGRNWRWGSTIPPFRFPTMGQRLRKESAVFGGGKRVYTGEFKGAKIDSVFSGFEIDLRQTFIVGDSAMLKVDAVFGGVEIRVPESWSVVVRGDAVFGGFNDSTLQPNPAMNPKKLFVKGSAVFGGVEIKN